MEAWTIIGVIASIVAAVGVVLELGLRAWNRPRAELELQPVTAANLGEQILIARNVGPAPLRGIWFRAVNCTLIKESENIRGGTIPDAGHGAITLRDAGEESFVLVGWNHPWRRSRIQVTWYPATNGPLLVSERARQLRRGVFARAAARLQRDSFAAPFSLSSTTIPTGEWPKARTDERLRRASAARERRLEAKRNGLGRILTLVGRRL